MEKPYFTIGQKPTGSSIIIPTTNAVTFAKNEEGDFFILLAIERKGIRLSSVETLYQKLCSLPNIDDSEKIVYEHSGDTQSVVFGLPFNPHAHSDLLRLIASLLDGVEPFYHKKICVNMESYPRLWS